MGPSQQMLISPTGKIKNIVFHSLLKFPFAVYNLVTFTKYPVCLKTGKGIVPVEAQDFQKG